MVTAGKSCDIFHREGREKKEPYALSKREHTLP